MLHKCVNSSCSNLFRRLQWGKPFPVGTHYVPIPHGSSPSRRNPPRRCSGTSQLLHRAVTSQMLSSRASLGRYDATTSVSGLTHRGRSGTN